MIVSGKRYSFMNCDTGRKLHCGGVTVFKAIAQGDGFVLSSGQSYLSQDGRFSACPVPFRFQPVGRDRYLILAGGAALTDTDEGFSPLASVGKTASPETVDACWYITEQGKTEPLRIMLLGDSITKGDGLDFKPEDKLGGRPRFVELLCEDPQSRFCLVGSLFERRARIDEKALYRHEGHCGWMGNDLRQFRELSRGLADHLDAWIGKYRPDLIFTLNGINDLGYQMGCRGEEQKPVNEQAIARVLAGQKRYFDKLWSLIGEDGILAIATIPPSDPDESPYRIGWTEQYLPPLRGMAEEYRKMGRQCRLVEVHDRLRDTVVSLGLGSDRVHLSAAGYRALGEIYAETVHQLFPGPLGR